MWQKLLTDLGVHLAGRMVGETTAVVVDITSSGIIGVSVGDSEAWVITDEGIDDLTYHQNKKRLGNGRASPVSFFRPTLDGALLLGSDGLFNYAAPNTIAEVVRGRAPSDAAEGLRAGVLLPSWTYPDDLGIVLVALRSYEVSMPRGCPPCSSPGP